MKKLPTGERMQKQNYYEDICCCSCSATLETDIHLFQCFKCPKVRCCINTELNRFQDQLDPLLFNILKSLINAYICGESLSTLYIQTLNHKRPLPISECPPTNNPYNIDYKYDYTKYGTLLYEQSQIG